MNMKTLMTVLTMALAFFSTSFFAVFVFEFLDDQTSVTLARDQHLRVRTHYAEPGQSVSSRNSKTKSAKKLVGFLAAR